MKIVTMYLPQFYVTEENNKWWGEGFTEWRTVNNAEPFFEGHNQPRKPMNGRYYNLLEKRTMMWQAGLMKEYHIYGQCFYHYWFKNGKRVLEKPAENLLKWKDIYMPFCFSWANEPWVRSWSAIVDANIWAQKYEPAKMKSEGNGVLLEQEYGTESDWKEHFDYLLTFFQDRRYIKIEGKPVFMIYRPDNILHLTEMVECWRRWAIDKGLPGIYFIGGNTSSKGCLDAIYFHTTGSMFPANYYTIRNAVKTIPYKRVWDYIVAQAEIAEKGTYIGGIVDFDTTPRKGKNGVVITGCNSLVYEKCLRKLLFFNEKIGNEITFINAWNEWGEGMYLEPDETNTYAFLDATRRALNDYKSEYIINTTESASNEVLSYYKTKMEQYKKNWMVLNQWLKRKEDNDPLEKTLKKKNIKTIAIYGLGIFGEHLKAELEKTTIEIKCIIDTRKQGMEREVPIIGLNDQLPNVDAIIVSVINEFEEILKQLHARTDIPVISLEDILFEQESDE